MALSWTLGFIEVQHSAIPLQAREQDQKPMPSIKLNKDIYNRVKRCADAAGYSSPQEFIEHVLERELEKIEGDASEEEIVEKLKGLGYIE